MGVVSGVLVVLHVLASIVGFGAVVATGACARVARRDVRAPAVGHYFRPGPNWASHALLLVPVFGAGLEAAQGWPDVGLAWPWIALVIWVVAAATGFAVHWPAERRIQQLVVPDETGGAAQATAGSELAVACGRAMWSSAVMTVAFAGALGVMLVQPR
jgi:hypothetical protein